MISTMNIKLVEHALFETFDDESVILNVINQEHYGLDEIASIFISYIHKDQPVSSALEYILDNYDVSQEQLESDLNNLIHSLKDHHLIEIH